MLTLFTVMTVYQISSAGNFQAFHAVTSKKRQVVQTEYILQHTTFKLGNFLLSV